MGNPSKPSSVKVSELQDALTMLKNMQYDMNNPPAGTFEKLMPSIETDLQQGDNGLQGNAAHVAGQRYEDGYTYIANRGWTDVKTGVATLISLLETTIAKHSTTDHQVASSANQTNTSQSNTTPPGSTSPATPQGRG